MNAYKVGFPTFAYVPFFQNFSIFQSCSKLIVKFFNNFFALITIFVIPKIVSQYFLM